MSNRQTEITLDFSNISGGMNTTDPPSSIKPTQCQLARNVSILRKGWTVVPGAKGLSHAATIDKQAKLLDCYFKTDGTDVLVMVADTKIYSVNKSSNAITELYTLGGNGEAWGASYQNKYFVANGTGCAKIEGTTAYKLGIAPPTGVSAIAAAGGTLPDGAYTLYASYARGNNLYSYGQSIGTVTLGGGNNTLDVNFPNSSDPQVSNKVIWAKCPGDSLTYFLYQTNNNTSTSIYVSSTATKDTSKNYAVLGMQSIVPPALEGIVAHNQSLYGWIGNVLYKSLPATTVYDLERWPDITYVFPFKILSLHSLGADLYLNTNRGMYCLPNGDMTAQYICITKRLYFKYPRTVAVYDDDAFSVGSNPYSSSTNNVAYIIGLTNDGVRIFDGKKFTIDLSADIKSFTDAIYVNSTSFNPCGVISNRANRTEYRLSFIDIIYGTAGNNFQLVLNLDTISWTNHVEYSAAWELWDNGFSYAVNDGSDSLFMCQVCTAGSQVIQDNSIATTDIDHFDITGVFKTSAVSRKRHVKSGIVTPAIEFMIDWEAMWVFSYHDKAASVKISVFDEYETEDVSTLGASGGSNAVFDEAVFDVDTFNLTVPIIERFKPKQTIKGGSFFFEYIQENDDTIAQVYEVKAAAKMQTGRYS